MQCWSGCHTTLTGRNSHLSFAQAIRTKQRTFLNSSPAGKNESDGDVEVKRTTFDDAGKSLIDEEDYKRMESMGDFDLNPDVSRILLALCFSNIL